MDDFKSRSPVASKSSNRASYTGTPLPSNIVEGRSSAANCASVPSLLRRSSYEPLHGKAQLGLGALPPPTFSRAPPGQRSVPAIEYLGGKASNAINGSPSNGNTATSRNSIDGSSSSSSLPLGNGLMAAEPWNLWSDPSVPISSSSPRSPSSTTGRSTRSPPQSATAHLDKMADLVVDDLASNIATTTLLDTDRLSKRSSKSSTSSATVPGDSAVWPQELSAAPAQPFALDPSASPSANLKASSSIDGADAQSQQPTLLPRNMSFSSLLDLPPNSDLLASNAVGSQLNRTSSLNRSYTRPTRSAGRATSALLASSMVEPIGELAQDANGLAATASLPALSLPETLRNGKSSISLTSSVASSLNSNNTARNGHTSPEQQRFAGKSTVSRPNSKPSINAAYGGAFSNSHHNGLAGGLVGDARSRQASGSSEACIASLSLPLQPLPSFSAGSQLGSFASLNINGPTSVPMRRDTDFRFAPFAASPPMQLGSNGDLHRRGSQPTWGLGGQYTGGRSLPFAAFSPSPPTSFGLSPEMSVGMTSSPSTGSSASSLYRYPSSGHDTYSSSPNFGLGFHHGSPAPLSSYPGYASFAAYDKPREDRMARPIRSALLETFRADKTGRWTVPDMRGHIAEFMCDQVGSRYIQEFILANPTPEDCDIIFEEVCPVILQLSIDVFANFCVQRLLEKSDTEQLKQLAVAMKGSVLRLSLQTYGCRVIQKAIEIVSPEHQLMFVQELEGFVQKCVRDQNANHVIQKIVQTVPADHLQCIVNAFVGNVYTFATHPYSCRVLQRILENCGDRMTRSLLEELKGYAQALMQDQYGNYVIQYIIERGLPYDRSGVICQTYGQVLHLSKHKFASNVIEKCIMQANENELHIIAAEVLMPRHDGTTGVMSMLKHEYANYPLQRLMKHTTGPLNRAIVDQVAANLTMFRHANPPFNAKHLVAIEKLVLDSDPSGFPSLYARRYEDHYVSSKKY